MRNGLPQPLTSPFSVQSSMTCLEECGGIGTNTPLGSILTHPCLKMPQLMALRSNSNRELQCGHATKKASSDIGKETRKHKESGNNFAFLFLRKRVQRVFFFIIPVGLGPRTRSKPRYPAPFEQCFQLNK